MNLLEAPLVLVTLILCGLSVAAVFVWAGLSIFEALADMESSPTEREVRE
jgi:hypothetical protein